MHLKKIFWHAIFGTSVLFAALGCGSSSGGITIARLDVVLEAPDAAPAAASVTAQLFYEALAAKRTRLDQDEAGATVSLDPAFVAALNPTAFARIVHVTDVQIREERGFLTGEDGTRILEWLNTSYTPTEGTKRQPLQETNSAFYWLATAMTIDAIHAAARPVDVVVSTGDVVDIGLRSELESFVHVAGKLDVPLLAASGNHDILGFGIWAGSGPALGARLDGDVDRRTAVEMTFQANADRLLLSRVDHAAAFSEIATRLGPHAPTVGKFASQTFGYDLGPAAQLAGLYYSVVLRNPAGGAPGLQLIVLETSNDDGGADANIDRAQLEFLNATLDLAATRQNLVVIAAHHPVFEVLRDNDRLGQATGFRTADALKNVSAMMSHYPNVVLYLTGHTHLPSIVEVRPPAGGDLQWTQIDTGSLLITPQEAAVVELSLLNGNTEVRLAARKFGAQIAGGSALAQRVAESRAAAATDVQSVPRYTPWQTYEGTRPLPAFPVTVPKFQIP